MFPKWGFTKKRSTPFGGSSISKSAPAARLARPAADSQGHHPGEARADPDGGCDRVRKIDDARVHARLPQRTEDGPYLHPRRTGGIHLPEQEIDREPARGRNRHPGHEGGTEERPAAG